MCKIIVSDFPVSVFIISLGRSHGIFRYRSFSMSECLTRGICKQTCRISRGRLQRLQGLAISGATSRLCRGSPATLKTPPTLRILRNLTLRDLGSSASGRLLGNARLIRLWILQPAHAMGASARRCGPQVRRALFTAMSSSNTCNIVWNCYPRRFV